MAIHNEVLLYAEVVSPVQVIKSADGEEYKRASCTVKVIRGPRYWGDRVRKLQFDSPVVLTNIPSQIKVMEQWKVHDMVYIKGFFASKNIKKKVKCKCGKETVFNGTLMYVQPIYLEVWEHAKNTEEANKLLQKKDEISNNVTALGTLCRDVTHLVATNGVPVTQFPIAINRKFHIREDNPDLKTDYPWIKSYGDIAEQCAKIVHTGSEIFLDGIIQTRPVERNEPCEHCGDTLKWTEVATEVVPYAVEFGRNCNSLMLLKEDENDKENSPEDTPSDETATEEVAAS